MLLTEISKKRIAYTCFDWGFGHVTRSIDLLRTLVAQENEIVFFGSAAQCAFVKGYLPNLECVHWSLPQLHFSVRHGFARSAFLNALRIVKTWRLEKNLLKKEHTHRHFDITFSDHRYAFRLPDVPSIFITHQFHLPEGTPRFIHRIHAKKMRKFSNIWVVDDAEKLYAGYLSQGAKTYIGILSRFSGDQIPQTNYAKKPLLVLSGPDNYAKQLLFDVRQVTQGKAIDILATSQLDQAQNGEVWHLVNTNAPQVLDEVYLSALVIISRTGYSTLMDLIRTKKQGILLATPGQLEQEYLAKINQVTQIACFTSTEAFQERLQLLFERYSS